MAKKIYSIVVLLLVVALIILGIGVYSISEITTNMAALIRQSRRVNFIDEVDKLVLERRIATDAVITSVDEDEMQRMIDGAMTQIEDRMDEALAQYAANFDSPPPLQPSSNMGKT